MKINLSNEEHFFINALKLTLPWVTHIARDTDGMLTVFDREPYEDEGDYINTLFGMWQILDTSQLPTITYDNSPVNLEDIFPQNGCDFCNKADFSSFMAKYGTIHLAGGSTKIPVEMQFKFCPQCGRPLELEQQTEPEKIKWTDEEITQAKKDSDYFNWVARNMDDMVTLFTLEPHKHQDCFVNTAAQIHVARTNGCLVSYPIGHRDYPSLPPGECVNLGEVKA